MGSLFPGLSSCFEAASYFPLGFRLFHLAESFRSEWAHGSDRYR